MGGLDRPVALLVWAAVGVLGACRYDVDCGDFLPCGGGCCGDTLARCSEEDLCVVDDAQLGGMWSGAFITSDNRSGELQLAIAQASDHRLSGTATCQFNGEQRGPFQLEGEVLVRSATFALRPAQSPDELIASFTGSTVSSTMPAEAELFGEYQGGYLATEPCFPGTGRWNVIRQRAAP